MNNAEASESVSIDSIKLREINQNSNSQNIDDIKMQKCDPKNVNPQIQAIIKNDDNNGSVKIQHKNSTAGQANQSD